jgi:hypothetical protein
MIRTHFLYGSECKRFTFIAYAHGHELPFEVVEQLISIARTWLPPIDTLEES